MNIYDIRRHNVEFLIKNRFSGVQRQFAIAIKKEATVVGRWLSEKMDEKNKRKIGDDTARDIEAALELEPDWMDHTHPDLWRESGIQFEDQALPARIGVRERRAEYLGPLSAWDESTPVDDDEVMRPCFTEVEASAGDGRSFVQENHGPKIRFSRHSLRKCGVDEHNAYGIRVKGDSMQPVLTDGAVIGIDVGCKRIIDGKTYAIDHGGMLRVKLLYRLPGNKVRIKSHNPEYQDEIISLDTEPEFKIIGRMFWHSALDYL